MKKKWYLVIGIVVFIVLISAYYIINLSPSPKDGGYSNIDFSCNVDVDCEIKDVGNLCGYFPLCVNKDFIPNPPELTSNICGFSDPDGCECVENECEGTSSGNP